MTIQTTDKAVVKLAGECTDGVLAVALGRCHYKLRWGGAIVCCNGVSLILLTLRKPKITIGEMYLICEQSLGRKGPAGAPKSSLTYYAE